MRAPERAMTKEVANIVSKIHTVFSSVHNQAISTTIQQAAGR